VNGDDVVQGRILWLPPKKDLPTRAVRRAHGKGAIEEGIFNHPVVVISRPAEEANIVHFHLVSNAPQPAGNNTHGRLDYFFPRQEASGNIQQGERIPCQSTILVPSNLTDARPSGRSL
jgi:hypothetical protein